MEAAMSLMGAALVLTFIATVLLSVLTIKYGKSLIEPYNVKVVDCVDNQLKQSFVSTSPTQLISATLLSSILCIAAASFLLVPNEFDAYKGSSGIDSIYRGKDGKIYIVESKATGTKYPESCTAGSLCTSNDGQQMSQDWINRKRLEASGLKSHEVDQVLEGLDENDGSVVRLYAGTSASGQTKFYEIHDRPGSTSKVTVDRAGDEYEFYQ